MNKYFMMQNGKRVDLELHEFGERKPQCHISNTAGVSYREASKAVHAAVRAVTNLATDYWIWIEDVWDDKFVYEIEVDGDNAAAGLWQRDYSITPNLEVTLGDAVPVIARKTYEPDVQKTQQQPTQMNQQSTWNKITQYVNNLFDNRVKEMDMKDMINAIVKNGKSGLTADQLAELPEAAVTAVYNGLHLNDEEGEAEAEPEPEADVEPTTGDEVPAWAQSLVSKVDGLASKVDGLTATANKASEQERANLVAELSRNSQCPFDESELKEFNIQQLKKLQVKFITPDYSAVMFGNGAENLDGYEYSGLAINAAAVEVG